MKRTKKLFLSLALIIGFAAVAPSVASFRNMANAEPAQIAYYIQVDKFVKSAIVGATYEIAPARALAIGSQTEVGSVEVSAKNPFGTPVTIEDDEFFVDYFGTYSVQYKYGDTIETLKFNATEGTYAFEFKQNSENIIPSSMTGNQNKKVVLENPTILDEAGEEVTIAGASVQILVKDSDGLAVTLADEGNNLKSFTPNKEGVWRIRYNFVSSQGKVLLSEEKTINVDNNLQTEFELAVSYATPATSADTKTEVTLPSVTVTNKATNNQVTAYKLDIKAYKITIVNGNDTNVTDVTAQTIDGRVFTPQVDGDYKITYTVTDFFGNVWGEDTITYIRDVKDRKAPEVKVVEAFDAEDLENFVGVGAEHKIPSKARSSHFVLPAIWAEDNVSTTLEDLTLTRRIRRSGTVVFETTENANKELVFNPQSALGENQVEATLSEGFTWTTGTYTILYIAKDQAGNESETIYYTVEIDNDFQEGVAPEVKWADNIKSQIRLGEKLTFNAPIATHETHSRLKTVVEYAYADTATADSAVTGWEVLELEGTIYEISIPETVASSVETLRLRTKTYSYDAESTFAYKTVRIFETQDENPVTIIEVDTTSVNPLNTYSEGNDITLGKFVFEDDLIDFVSTEIIAVAENGQRISVVNAKRTLDRVNGTLAIENAKFFASFAGTYTITIRATDINDNIVTYSYTIEIAPYQTQIEPHFASPKTIHDGIVELGTTIEIPEAIIISNLTEEVPYNVNVIDGPANFRINTYEFEAFEEGIYTIQYSAVVNTETITATFTVEVKDKKAPEIAGWAEVKNTIEDLSNPTIPTNGIEFRIPAVAVTDNSAVDMKNSKVEVKRGNVIITTITLEDLTPTLERAKLNLTQNALYTVTYTIKDTAQTPNTKTFVATITVGDNILPKVELVDTNKKLTSETAKINSTLDLNLSKIKFYDPGHGDLTLEDLEITLRVNGEDVTNKHAVEGEDVTMFGYDLKTAGNYTLSIRVKDAANNWSEYYTETFTVTAQSNDGVETTEVIGVVLIVISALILAGSIIYFIISKRKVDEYKGK